MPVWSSHNLTVQPSSPPWTHCQSPTPHSCFGVFAHRPPFPHWEKPSPSPASSQRSPQRKPGSPFRLPPPRSSPAASAPSFPLLLQSAHPLQLPFSKCLRRILLFICSLNTSFIRPISAPLHSLSLCRERSIPSSS